MDSRSLNDMFALGLPIVEKVVRPVLVYVFLVVGLRLAGKRELAQVNTFDLVVLLTISNTVQNAIIGDDTSVTGGLLGAATLLLVNHFVVRFSFLHERLDRWVGGEPAVLIQHGVVKQDGLRHELITLAELRAAAHRQGFASLEEVETATIEPGGSLSFVPKRAATDAERHAELLVRLDQLSAQVARLRPDPTSA